MKSLYCASILLLTLSACGPPAIYVGPNAPAPPQLMVRGQGTVEADPDQLQLRLGVLTEATEAETALQHNNRRMAAVMATLREIGIADDELATGQFQITPTWSQPPRPAPANWQRQILGYRVNNELLVATRRVELAGRLLAAAQKSGANQISGLQFTLADPEEHRQRAIALATAKAIREAQTLARAAGASLGPLQSLTLDPPAGVPGPMLMMAEARSASADSVPLAAGKVEVSAAVSLVYQLGQSAAPPPRQ